MKKICSRCEVEKSDCEFNKNKAKADGYQGCCRSCQKTYDKRYYENNGLRRKAIVACSRKHREETRAWLKSLKRDLGCLECPENHPACIEFHHREGEQKEFEISSAVLKGWSRKRIVEEIAKCDNLCANCHRKLHWPEA